MREMSLVVKCDVCGVELPADTETIQMVKNGREAWTMDLCATHRAELREFFESRYPPSRKVAKHRQAKKKSGVEVGIGAAIAETEKKGRTSTVSAANVRSWAASSGIAVNAKGRIPRDVIAAYTEYHRNRKVAS